MLNDPLEKRKYTPLIMMALAFFLLNSCGLLGGDNEPSIQWEEEDLSDYVLYAFTPFIDYLTIIDVPTGEILKTLEDLDGIQSVVTNKDGTRLYVSTGTLGEAGVDPGEIIKINTETWEREIIFEQAAELLSNRNGDIFFITKHIDPDVGPVIPERVLGRIDPMYGAITLIDTLNVEWRATNDRHSIEISEYAPEIIALNSEKQLYRYNYDTGDKEFLFEGTNFYTFARMHLSYDGNYLLIPGGPVLDLTNEKVAGSLPTWRLGTAALRRDMKEVYITDPGGYLRDPLPAGEIAVFDFDRNRLIGQIPIEVEDDAFGGNFLRMTDQIYLTKNERYAIANDWMSTYFVIDLRTRKVIQFSTYVEDNVSTLSIQRITLSKKPSGF